MSIFPEISAKMSPEALQVIMDEIEISLPALAERLDVNDKTVRRWLHGEVPIPAPVALLMNVAHDALRFSHAWRGVGMSVDAVPTKRVDLKRRLRDGDDDPREKELL